MTKITKSLLWAAIIIGFAFASIFEVVTEDFATTMIVVLPLLAWMHISGQFGCAPCPLFSKKEEA